MYNKVMLILLFPVVGMHLFYFLLILLVECLELKVGKANCGCERLLEPHFPIERIQRAPGPWDLAGFYLSTLAATHAFAGLAFFFNNSYV